MNIGIFDSGLGGLLITKSLIKKLPQYNYTYLGDTKRVPYGNRSPETIYDFLKESVEYLFENNCKLILVACNTASAQALRKIQQEFLPEKYPDRRVLGVIIPTCEVALENKKSKKIGILATNATVNSNAFIIELKKIKPDIQVIQNPAPLLVPFIENDSLQLVTPVLEKYLKPFKGKID
ncbi:glutamate racemase, partial [Candidatus Parcubacteria bacterium]|nr:glutamate racemase [Candidatus Parcubacteria bacterium]